MYHDPHESGAKFTLRCGDLTDSTNLIRLIQEIQPDEIYNLAAQSHIKVKKDNYLKKGGFKTSNYLNNLLFSKEVPWGVG